MKKYLIILLLLLLAFDGISQRSGGRNAYRLGGRNANRGLEVISSTDTTKWYFAATGNDANSGHSTSAPKQTIAELNSLALETSDKVYFNAADTFNDAILTVSADSITFDKYGTGANPIISTYWNMYAFQNVTVSNLNIGTTINTLITNEDYYMVTNEGDIMVENY